MNKQELIAAVADATGLGRSDAGRAVEGVFDTITGALKRGDEVRLVGFGTFSVASRAASEGRNPRTGEKIQIAASKQAKFKPGKGLRYLFIADQACQVRIGRHQMLRWIDVAIGHRLCLVTSRMHLGAPQRFNFGSRIGMATATTPID